MAKTWQAASKEAMTVLGPKGKIPGTEPNLREDGGGHEQDLR